MRSLFVFLVVLMLAACLGQVGSDIYAPSLPAIAKDLSATVNQAQWSMAIFMLGIAVSQLVYGPISEGFGRKPILLIGLVIMMVGTVICFKAPTIQVLIGGRLVQGLGAGACAALWRSMFRDLFTGEDIAKYGAYLTIGVTLIIPAAPTLGGYLQEYFGWRSSFSFMMIYIVVVILLVIFILYETNTNKHIEKLKPKFLASAYKELLLSPIFMGCSLLVFLCYGAFFAWFVSGPILLIHLLHISPVYFGWLNFVSAALAMALSGYLNGRFVKKLGIKNMLRIGWVTMLVAGLLMLVLALIVGMNVWTIFIPVVLFMFGVSFIWPNTFASAFTPFGHIAGYAASLYGFMQIVGGAVLGGLISRIHEINQLPMAYIFIGIPVVCLIIYETLLRPRLERVAST